MADSPQTNASDVMRVTIKADGAEIKDTIQVAHLQVHKAINRISTAQVVLLDGDMPTQTFPVSDADTFKPGAKIEIEAAYGDGSPQTLFSGLVIKHGLKITPNNESTLVLECKDAAVKMTIGRKNTNFIKLSDGDSITDNSVISQVMNNYSDLSTSVGETSAELNGLVQYDCTDWDFVVSRAEANGMLVMLDDGTVKIDTPDTSASAKLTLTYGQDIMAFEADLDPSYQFSQVTGVGWDTSQLAIVDSVVAATADSSTRGEKNGSMTDVIGLSDFRLQSQTTLPTEALKGWATGQQNKSQLSQLRGTVRFQGNATFKTGDNLELIGVGERFSGTVFVSAIEHQVEHGNWTTEVEFGMSPRWFATQPEVVAPSASGLMPGALGLQVGIVKQLDQDPQNQYRILVSVPVLQADNEGVWARLVQFYASDSFGAFFVPEIGDEVVLGYFNNDPANPVVLGSLYSGAHAAAQQLTAENYTKQLLTKSQLMVQFDDEKKVITVQTPGGHSLVMDDDQQNVVMKDSNGNSMEMNSSGITVKSPGDIQMSADGNITLKATGNVEATATGDAKVSGMNVQLSAQTALTAQGNASAEVSASGTTTVKGAMVMIN